MLISVRDVCGAECAHRCARAGVRLVWPRLLEQ
jgi:hypothetical protein